MQPGEIRIFKKSGNEVMLQELASNSIPRSWVVVRTKGASAGKQMICLERCLVACNQFSVGE